MKTHVLVLGLDAATFDLIEPWVKEGRLPSFQRLMETGAWGRLESTIPPVTAVAWNTFATGKNPGKHGVFDFVRREADGYSIRVVSGGSRRTTPFWSLLDRYGLRVGVINMPMTYPPDRLEHGFVISGFDAPGVESDFVYPPHLKTILRRNNYVIHSTKTTREAWARDLFEAFEVQKKAFWELYNTQPWDVLVMVFMQLDVAQHLFWREMETLDPRFGSVIPQLYQNADTLLGEVLKNLDSETTLMVISDHGAGPLKKVVSVNQWLFREGYLVLRKQNSLSRVFNRVLLRILTLLNMYLPKHIKAILKRRLAWVRDDVESYFLASQVDWEKTRAFALGEYGGIYINLQGREAKGTVPPQEYDYLRSEITARLVTLRDPDTGEAVIQRVYRREEIYDGPYVDEAPDLVLHWNYAYDCRERAGSERRGVFESEITFKEFADYKKTGVHRHHGVFFAHGLPIQSGSLKGALLMDIAPTVFHILGIPVPADMDGRVLTEAFKPEWLVQHPIVYENGKLDDMDKGTDSGYGADEEKQVKERLRALGYLD